VVDCSWTPPIFFGGALGNAPTAKPLFRGTAKRGDVPRYGIARHGVSRRATFT